MEQIRLSRVRVVIAGVGVVLGLGMAVNPDEASAAGVPAESHPSRPKQLGFQNTIKACRGRYAALDSRIDQAGVRDAGYYRVPGFPYMRSDRLIASYGPDLAKLDSLSDWLYQLRENDGFSRSIELQNLGLPMAERVALLSELRLCAVWLSNLEISRDSVRERLIAAVRVPADSHRPAGDASDAVGVQEMMHRQAARVKASYAIPASDLDSPGPLVLWRAKPDSSGMTLPMPDSPVLVHDGLGRIGLTEDQWSQLASRYAPSFLVETGSELDRIGAPSLGDHGSVVEVSEPVVYFQVDYARLGASSLVQIDYFAWFPARAAAGPDRVKERAPDGLIWRVTLDPTGQPLVYDTIHADGLDHLWFPLPALNVSREAALDHEATIPQPDVPNEFVVRVRSGTHEVRRLISTKDARSDRMTDYELHRYEELLTLPLPSGGTHSLFGPEGIVVGAGSGAGLVAVGPVGTLDGPVRQWGHHPISPLGDLYFDDPRLIERELLTPSPAAVLRGN
jgi:hypothetical protein